MNVEIKVVVSEMGENIIVTAGEVHLQRCLADLTQVNKTYTTHK